MLRVLRGHALKSIVSTIDRDACVFHPAFRCWESGYGSRPRSSSTKYKEVDILEHEQEWPACRSSLKLQGAFSAKVILEMRARTKPSLFPLSHLLKHLWDFAES